MAKRVFVERALARPAVSSLQTVRQAMGDFVERTRTDELMITSQVFDHAARQRS